MPLVLLHNSPATQGARIQGTMEITQAVRRPPARDDLPQEVFSARVDSSVPLAHSRGDSTSERHNL